MLEIVTSRLHNIPKTVAILLGSFAVFVVLYAKSMDLPITFLGILFLTSLVLMTFLPSKIEVATLLIIAIMGTIAAFISPINDIPDERVHFARALYLSEGNINLSNDDSKLVVSDDINIIDHNTGQPLQHQLWLKDKTQEMISFKEIRSTNGYYNFSYIPQAIGLVLSKCLGLPIGIAYLLGRICNVLAYGLLVYIALKIADKGQQLLAVASLLPMNIYIAGSFNQDAVSLGLIILTISLFVRMITISKIKISYLLFYTLICSVIAFTKLPYILLIFLLVFIPSDKFEEKKYQVLFFKLLSILIVLLVTVTWLKLYGQIKSPQIDMAEFLQRVNLKQQLISIIKHPISYGATLLKHTLLHLINPAGIEVFGPLSYGMTELFPLSMVYYAMVVINNANKVKISSLSRVGMGLISLGIIGGIVLSLYLTFTPVGEATVLGVQDRYFLGIIPLIFVWLSFNNKRFEKCQNILSDRQVATCSLIFILAMIIRVMLQYYT